MPVTSRSSFSASFSTSDCGDVVQEAQEAVVAAERPDDADVDGAVVAVMGDAVAVGEDTFAYVEGFSVVDGNSFYVTVDLIAVATSETDIAYTSTAALMTCSSSADAVFSIQTTRTHSVTDANGSLSASTTSGGMIGISWTDDQIGSIDIDSPDLDDMLANADGCGELIDGNVAFAIGSASAFGDDSFTDLSLSTFTMEDTISSASVSIVVIG